MNAINHEVLMQFTSKGLAINEGIAIDARLVQSASHPLSTEKLGEAKAKSEAPEGKVDKNGNPLKFSTQYGDQFLVAPQSCAQSSFRVHTP